MSAGYVRSHYGVDFKQGDRVTVNGKPGRVVSFPGQYVGVRLDGDKHTSRCHPTWRVEKVIDDRCRITADGWCMTHSTASGPTYCDERGA